MKKGLVVSCQALPNEPLYSSMIMGNMALAAKQGGAIGIRANTCVDIKEIKKIVDLPIIGLIKQEYSDSEVYITPTLDEVDQLVKSSVDIIAVDATKRSRPNGLSLDDFYSRIRKKYIGVKLMADCSTLEETIYADKLGFDYIGTTLVGYTPESRDLKIETNDFQIIKEILLNVTHPVVAEGNIDTPEKARRVLELGCSFVVVGGAITRPQQITEKFVSEIEKRRT